MPSVPVLSYDSGSCVVIAGMFFLALPLHCSKVEKVEACLKLQGKCKAGRVVVVRKWEGVELLVALKAFHDKKEGVGASTAWS